MALSADPASLIDAAARGERRPLARLISIVEDDRAGAFDVLRLAASRAGDGYRIGITGAPGAGKSTLTDRLIGRVRGEGKDVAVLAVDPTSPFSGGAVLGDRVRMQDWASDAGVFIRSMASRGHLGGLSAAAPKALALLEAAGFPYVLIETVGVGQDEVDVARSADTTVVVVTPGWGNGIQAAKAGILEIGDVFVVNKADRPGVDDAVGDLRAMLSMGEPADWIPPIIPTIAAEGTGVEQLWEAVIEHRRHQEGTGGLDSRRRRRRRSELETALRALAARRARDVVSDSRNAPVVEHVEAGELDPWTAAEGLFD